MSAVQSLRFECAPPGDPQAQAEWLDGLTDRLIEAGALTVSVEDPHADQPDDERPLYGEPGMAKDMQAWPLCRVTVLLDAQVEATGWWTDWLVTLEAPYEVCRGCVMEAQPVEDCDWVSKTQGQFRPILLESSGRPIWVGPNWHEPPPRFLVDPALVLRIDPGMAFGTGGHATTQLCLQALQLLAEQHPLGRVLDYGCGSGILAIAAAKLGATSVGAIDIDPVSLSVAQANVERNGVSGRVQCALPGGPGEAAPFDLIVANILAQPLKLLAPLLWRLVRPGGGLILSGLLLRQQDELVQAYQHAAPDRPSLTALGHQEGWLCLGVWRDALSTQPSPLGDSP